MIKGRLKGLTLAELLLATAILAFALSGLLILFINCTFLNEGNRNLTVAMAHAEYIMEEIRSRESAGIAGDLAAVEASINNGDWDLGAAAIEANPYNLTALHNELINTNVTQGGDPLGVSLSVSWDDRRGRSRSVSLTTLMTDYK
jgi:hypothetical protein